IHNPALHEPGIFPGMTTTTLPIMTVYSHGGKQGGETASAATPTTVNLPASDPPVNPSPIAEITDFPVSEPPTSDPSAAEPSAAEPSAAEPHVPDPPHGPIRGRTIEITTDDSY